MTARAVLAHFRLFEFYHSQKTPQGVDAVKECCAAIAAYAGTPEEGLGHLILGDVLDPAGKYDEAFAEYQTVIEKFPDQPYASFAHIRYGLSLEKAKKWQPAIVAVAPVMNDPPGPGGPVTVRGKASPAWASTRGPSPTCRRRAKPRTPSTFGLTPTTNWAKFTRR